MKNAWLTLGVAWLTACGGTTPYRSPQPEVGPDGQPPIQVGFLIVDGVYNTELTAPFDVLHHSMFRTEPGMRVFTVAPTRRTVVTFEGLRIQPDYGFADAPELDVLVVPSAHHSLDTDLENAELIQWVRAAGEGADLILSLCDGAFVLAEAGLLDGLEATTFPGDLEAFEQRYGSRLAAVHRDVSFVHDGKAITSPGGAVSFDAALYLHELYFGTEATRATARGLVLDWDRGAVAHVVAQGARRPRAPSEPLHLIVLHTNDVHGQLRPRRGRGGLRRLAARVAEIRAGLEPHQELLVLDAGDWFQGTPEGKVEGGAAFLRLLVDVGYDAMAVGNHELDHGVGHLEDLLAEVRPPALCANVFDPARDARAPWGEPYRIVERGGLRIALVGLLSTETPTITHPEARSLEYRDPVETLDALLAELEGRTDLVIPLTHLGLGDDVRLAEAFDLPLVVGGHSHTVLEKGREVSGTLVVQAGSKAQSLGRVDLWIEPGSGAVTAIEASLVGLEQELEPPEAFARACDALSTQTDAEMAVVVGSLAAPLDRRRGVGSSPAGNLITDAFRARAGTPIGIHNKGGTRTSLASGEVTRRELFELLPFDNTLVVLEPTGAQLWEALRRAVEDGGHSGLDVSGLTVVTSAVGGESAKLLAVELEGQPLVPSQTYRVATNSFLGQGGDGYFDAQVPLVLDTGLVLRDVLEQVLATESPLQPPTDPRFVVR